MPTVRSFTPILTTIHVTRFFFLNSYILRIPSFSGFFKCFFPWRSFDTLFFKIIIGRDAVKNA
jgi:hypothetical protein